MARSGGTWKPGQSGNPNGRPLIASRYKRILAETDPVSGQSNEERIAHVYVEQAKKGSLAAWEHILERVEGKVPDVLNASVKAENEHSVSQETVEAIVAAYAGRVQSDR